MLPRTKRGLLLLVASSLILWQSPASGQWPLDGRAVCTAAAEQILGAITSDGAGGAIVAWEDRRRVSGSIDIYAQRVLASGVVDPAWPPDGLVLCSATDVQWTPAMISDGAGGAIVAWMDARSGNFDIYAQRVLASGAVDPAWPVDGLALCSAAGVQGEPAIVSDGAGGAIVAWQDGRIGPYDIYDIYAQHVLASGVVDPAWPLDGRALCTAAQNQVRQVIVSDGAGGAIVAWQDSRNGLYDIYAQHVLASGAVGPAWPVDGRALCTAAQSQLRPVIVPDGAGGAIVAWDDTRSGTSVDIYAQRVLASGAVDPAWPVGGRSLCTATQAQEWPAIGSDGAGGAIVAWQDARSGDYDIYAQRVLASGAVDPAWPLDGRALCTAVQGQYGPAVVSDGAGGEIVMWSDRRSGHYDIYAQRVLASGAVDPAWPLDGRALCTATDDQSNPAIVSDGAGGAIAAWMDWRSGPNVDIYAQRVWAGGGVTAVTPGLPEPPDLIQLQPNPTHGRVTINFHLAAPQRISVEVFDALGRCVRSLAAHQEFPSGTHSMVWGGGDRAGVSLKSGVYSVRLGAGSRFCARKLVLLR